jgi:hypothetical protein
MAEQLDSSVTAQLARILADPPTRQSEALLSGDALLWVFCTRLRLTLARRGGGIWTNYKVELSDNSFVLDTGLYRQTFHDIEVAPDQTVRSFSVDGIPISRRLRWFTTADGGLIGVAVMNGLASLLFATPETFTAFDPPTGFGRSKLGTANVHGAGAANIQRGFAELFAKGRTPVAGWMVFHHPQPEGVPFERPAIEIPLADFTGLDTMTLRAEGIELVFTPRSDR